MAVDISVLVPVYRSEKSLQELCHRLIHVLGNICNSFEIILVDDCSPDDSLVVMQNLRQADPRVKIIQLAANFGQHNATFCGFKYCQGEFIITMDDDLQHAPEEIPILLSKIQEGYDVVMGIPHKRQDAFYKNWGSLIIDKCLNFIFNKPPTLRMSSFRILRCDLAKQISDEPRSKIYIGALILSNSNRLANVKVKHEPRKYGRSNYSLKKSTQLAWTLLTSYSELPLRIVGVLWQLMLAVSIIMALLTVSWISLIPQLLLSLALVLLSLLGLSSWLILSSYIIRIKEETIQPQPAYIIEQLYL